MKRIKSFIAGALMTLIVLAGFGFGIMATGFAIVLGGAFALTLRLVGPSLMADIEQRANEPGTNATDAEPAAA